MNENEAAPKLLTTKQAAELMGMQAGTLENWRNQGKGPPWIKVGARSVRYWDNQVLEWLKSRQTVDLMAALKASLALERGQG